MNLNIIKAATEFYSSLYTSSKGDRWQGYSLPPNVDMNDQTPPIIQSEVRVAIEELKARRPPGEDHIHNEHLKQDLEHLLESLTTIFNKILHTEEIPNQWKLSIFLHKEDAKDDLQNYRPISLMSSVYKFFSIIIRRRITKKLDENQSQDQADLDRGIALLTTFRQ